MYKNKILNSPIMGIVIVSVIGLLGYFGDKFFTEMERNKQGKIDVIEKQLRDFYIPLDSILSSSLRDWKYLTKGNNSLTYWDTIQINSQEVLDTHRTYLVKTSSQYNAKVFFDENETIGVQVNSTLRLHDSKDNKFILHTEYSQIFFIKYNVDFLKSLTSHENISEIKIFLPYLDLDSSNVINIPTKYSLKFKSNYSNKEKIIEYAIGIFVKYTQHKDTYQLIHSSGNIYILSNITKEKRDKWVKNMLNIFQPYHKKLENLIHDRRYLVKDKYLSKLLDRLVFHIDGYKLVFSQWERKDFSLLASRINFPSDINIYVKNKILNLKEEYKRISGHTYK